MKFKDRINELGVMSRWERIKELGVMIRWEDSVITNEIVANQYTSSTPLKIIEFGAGNAGWCVFMSEALATLPSVYAWENFEHTTYLSDVNDSSSVYYQLTRNKQELMSLIDIRIADHNIEIVEEDAEDSAGWFKNNPGPYDVIRLDCMDEMDRILNVLDCAITYLKPGGLLLVDDIEPMTTINRFRAAMSYVDSGRLHLVYVGLKEAIFQKPGASPIDIDAVKDATANIMSSEVVNNVINAPYLKFKYVSEKKKGNM